MQIDVLFASVPVRDLGTATDWYGRLLGHPPDIVPNDDEVMWMLAEHAWLYVIADADRAGRTVVSMAVPDLDAATRTIDERGIHVASTEIIGDAGRKASYLDPDGNSIVLIEVNEPG